MGYQTLYCVQTYRRQGRGLERGALRSYGLKSAALEDGRLTRPRYAGVLVYSVEVDTGAREAGRICVLARHGDVPEIRY